MLEIYKSQENGHIQEMTLNTIEKGSWINIIDPTPYELKLVSALTEVEPDFLRSALDDEERSHPVQIGDVLSEVSSTDQQAVGRDRGAVEAFDAQQRNTSVDGIAKGLDVFQCGVALERSGLGKIVAASVEQDA